MECDVMERLVPEKAMQLLKDDGIEVDEEQAKIILDFLYDIAEIVVDQYLSNPP